MLSRYFGKVFPPAVKGLLWGFVTEVVGNVWSDGVVGEVKGLLWGFVTEVVGNVWSDGVESVATDDETLVIRMSTTTSNTNFLNGFYRIWRWGCLKLLENSRHGGSHNTGLLIDCMNCHMQQHSKNLGRLGLRHCRKCQVDAIVVPSILAEQFELKHSLINMMTSDQFFGLEKENPHDHIRWGSPPVVRKRTLAFYSHLGGSCFQIHQ
nr:reverse transcriptase domain-containing protein [Tanacetum cinerariifolium]